MNRHLRVIGLLLTTVRPYLPSTIYILHFTSNFLISSLQIFPSVLEEAAEEAARLRGPGRPLSALRGPRGGGWHRGEEGRREERAEGPRRRRCGGTTEDHVRSHHHTIIFRKCHSILGRCQACVQ